MDRRGQKLKGFKQHKGNMRANYEKEIIHLWLQSFPNTSFGITSVMFKNLEEYKPLLKCINLHQILVESDAPYLDAKQSSMCIPKIVEYLSKLREIPLNEMYTMILENTRRVYNIVQ